MAIDDLFLGESKKIEYKSMVPEKSEKYMKSIIAFANTQGGRLIIGVFRKKSGLVERTVNEKKLYNWKILQNK